MGFKFHGFDFLHLDSIEGGSIERDAAPNIYLAKRSCKKTEAFNLPNVNHIYSVSSCVNYSCADYIDSWKQNGCWLFDSPEIIVAVAKNNAIGLQGTMLFYFEAHDMEFAEEGWRSFAPETGLVTNIVPSPRPTLQGFDVVTFLLETCLNVPRSLAIPWQKASTQILIAF
jgi:hypothetical protein